MNPEVSVIIPCYNQAAYLSDAINSVQAQTFTNWECVIVNDGSTDNTNEVATQYSKDDARIKYFETKNGGPSAARNYGISKASAAYILPLDADDKISTNYLEECFKTIQLHPEIFVVYGKGEKFGLVNKPWNLLPYDWNMLPFKNMIHSCGMYKKTDWERVGGYDVNLIHGIEDWEFWINLSKENKHAICLDNIRFFYRIKEQSRHTEVVGDNIKMQQMKQYLYFKHAGFYNNWFTDPIQLFRDYENGKKTFQLIEKRPFYFAFSRVKKRIKKYWQ